MLQADCVKGLSWSVRESLNQLNEIIINNNKNKKSR